MGIAMGKATVQKALSAHSAIGLICCALLYLICVTGTAIVLYEEWQRFEQPGAPEMASIEPAAIQRGIENVLESEKAQATTTHLFVHLPTDALPRTTITTDTQAVHIDAAGGIVMPEENAWAKFVLALHYRLNLPAIVGMTLVGALGAMMVALAISGTMAHPRIFRDAFRLRARRKDDIATVDWHNRLAVWTLPFGIAIALTGAIIGLFYVSGFGMAATAYGGDVERVTEAIFGEEGEPDPAPAVTPDILPALNYMTANFEKVTPYYVILHDPQTAGQHIQIIGEHPQRRIFGEYYAFDGDGQFLSSAGLADGSIGQQLAASTYNLHFGNFGGLPVKIAYIVFGLALSAIAATGTFIWLNRRERRGLPAKRLRTLWWAVVIGTPLGLVTTLVGRLLYGNSAPFVSIFWATFILTAISVAAFRWRRVRLIK